MTPEQHRKLAEALERLAEQPTDEEAWHVVFVHSWATALATANQVFRGVLDLAEDAAQESFARILRYGDFQELRDPTAFLSYLKAICRRVARDDLVRLARRTGHASVAELEAAQQLLSQTPTPEQDLVAMELEEDLMKQLNEGEQVLLKLLIEGYGVSEICEKFEIGYSAAGVRVFRLREKLAKYLISKKLK
jgi:RNA polymerase sigma factor (sigma-70 family)